MKSDIIYSSYLYFRTSVLFVEDPIGQKERIPVSIDITLPKMRCERK